MFIKESGEEGKGGIWRGALGFLMGGGGDLVDLVGLWLYCIG